MGKDEEAVSVKLLSQVRQIHGFAFKEAIKKFSKSLGCLQQDCYIYTEKYFLARYFLNNLAFKSERKQDC